MKNYLKHYALLTLTVISLVFSGCKKDDIVETDNVTVAEEVLNTEKINRVNYEELKQDHVFNNLINTFKLKDKLDSQFNDNEILGNRNHLKSNDDFIIDTNYANKVITENYTIYTLSVKRKKESLYNIENFVLKIEGQTTKAYLVTYYFTKETLHKYLTDSNHNLKIDYKVLELSKDGKYTDVSKSFVDIKNHSKTDKKIENTAKSGNCVYVEVAIPYFCTCKGKHAPWQGGCTCPADKGGRARWIYDTERVCGTGDSGLDPIFTVGYFDGNGIRIGNSGSLSASNPQGGGGLGGGGELPTLFVTGDELALHHLNTLVTLTSSQINWFLEGDNINYAPTLLRAINENNFSNEAISFVEEMINLLDTGNTNQKRFANAVLSKNISQALIIAIEGAQFQQCCDENDVSGKMAWFTAKLVFDFHDAMFNLVKMTEDLFYTDEEEGKFVKIIMENSGVTVPADVSDETIGRLFKVRYDGLEMIVEPTGEWYTPFVDAAVTFLDIVAVLAPSSNGGAFLMVKGGGKITAQTLSDYLKVLGRDANLAQRLNALSSTKLNDLIDLMKNQKKPAGFAGKYNFTATKTIDGKQVSVKYDENGFPDFTSYASSPDHVFKADNLAGNGTDMTRANNFIRGQTNVVTLSNGKVKINGVEHTWHHHQDGKSMFPVPSGIHNVRSGGFAHSGGAAIISRGLQGLFKGPNF
ncbi:HNH endonuclease [Aquimarina sp. MMG016]|uniref:HNH endonuclease n=1 Tax=Aquimarina sp. MMG016 TaxID=2822690 RepID=UPI001B3A139A|nr:HNH endonuclease [Aquimarina sp. MMG016]MBQ4821512.1 HNH endonuclease [Aquimarina sp. MMG016]